MKSFLVSCYLCLSLICTAQSTFQKRYYFQFENAARYLTQCSDSGFIFSVVNGFSGGMDLFKTDPNGSIEWVFDFPSECQGFNVIETPDQNFLASGFRNENSGLRLAPFILKISSGGNLIWSKGFNYYNSLISSFSVTAVVQSGDSGYVLMSSLPLNGNNNFDVVAIKTDSSGNIIWTQDYGGLGNDWGTTIIRSKPSGYLILGNTDTLGPQSKMIFKIDENGTVQWATLVDAADFGEPIQQANDYGYVFICGGTANNSLCKVDSSGNFLWSKTYTSFLDVSIESLLITSDGGIAISGFLSDTFNRHAFIAKLDSSGNSIWTKYFNDSISCSSASFALVHTLDGGFAFSGYQDIPLGEDLLLVKTDSLGYLSCPSSSIPGFQSSVNNNPNSSFILNSQLILLSDSSVSSNSFNPPYYEESFCFAPINNSVSETRQETSVVYPNPFHSSAKITFDKSFNMRDGLIKIFNSFGEPVRSEKITLRFPINLDRGQLNNGIYYYELISSDYELIGKGKFILE